MPFSDSNLPIQCPRPAVATLQIGTVRIPHTPASTLPYAQNSEQTTAIRPTSTSASTKNRTRFTSSSSASQRLSTKTSSASTPVSTTGRRSRKRKIIDHAAAKLCVASQSPQQHRSLRESMMQQRRAKPLFMSSLQTNLTDFSSPTRAGTTKPQRWTKKFDEFFLLLFVNMFALYLSYFSLSFFHSRISAPFFHVVVVSGLSKIQTTRLIKATDAPGSIREFFCP